MDSIYIVLLIGLLICSWEDVRSRMVSLPFVIVWTGLLCGMRLYQGDFSIILSVASMAALGVVVAANRLSKGGIGLGDGFLLAMTVIGLGVVQSLQMIAYCFLGAFCAAVILLVLFSGKKDTRIPLAPFILAGSLLAIFSDIN